MDCYLIHDRKGNHAHEWIVTSLVATGIPISQGDIMIHSGNSVFMAELTKTEACAPIAVGEDIAARGHPKVTIADPHCFQIEIQFAEAIPKIRTNYLRPEGSRLAQLGVMINFENIDDNTTCAGDLNWNGGVGVQIALGSRPIWRPQEPQALPQHLRQLDMGTHSTQLEKRCAAGEERPRDTPGLESRRHDTDRLHMVPCGDDGERYLHHACEPQAQDPTDHRYVMARLVWATTMRTSRSAGPRWPPPRPAWAHPTKRAVGATPSEPSARLKLRNDAWRR